MAHAGTRAVTTNAPPTQRAKHSLSPDGYYGLSADDLRLLSTAQAGLLEQAARVPAWGEADATLARMFRDQVRQILHDQVRPAELENAAGDAAGPVIFVVEPRLQAQCRALFQRVINRAPIVFGEIFHLHPCARMEKHASDALPRLLRQSPTNVVGVEVGVQEPKRDKPIGARWVQEAVAEVIKGVHNSNTALASVTARLASGA